MDSPSQIYNEGGPLSLGSAVHASYNPLSGPSQWYADTFGHNRGIQPFQQGDMAQDPTTGLWVNRNTGLIYSDPNGQRPVSNLDLHQLTSRNTAISNNLYGQSMGTNAALTGAIGQQQQFAGSLQDVINGTAPSVANDQLYQSLNNIRSNQLSQASGASGQNAVLANQNAQRNIAGASIDTANNAATLRAQETAQARAQQGQTLGDITGAIGNQYGRQLNAAQGASQQAVQGQESAQGIEEKGDEKNKDLALAGGQSGAKILGLL